MLGGDVGGAAAHGLAVGALQHALGARRERNVTAGHGLAGPLGDLLDGLDRVVIGDVELGEGLGGDAVPLLDEAQQQMLGANVHLAERPGLVLREAHDLARLVSKLVEHVGLPLGRTSRDTRRIMRASLEMPARPCLAANRYQTV